MIVYIDTFALLFRSYYSVKDLSTKDGTPIGAVYGLTTSLIKIIEKLKPDYIIACFDSPEKTLRQEIDETYKANRIEVEEDFIAQIPIAKDLLRAFGVHIVEKIGYEADDLLGTLAKKDASDGSEVVIVTCDGDMFQLTTDKHIRVYYLSRGVSDFMLYDDKKVYEKNGYPAKYITDYKGLAGDTSDNIKGVKGIGKTFATRLINTYGGLEKIYESINLNKLKKDGFTDRVIQLLLNGKEDAFTSRDLATIHTDVPIIRPHTNEPVWSKKVNTIEVHKKLEHLSFVSLIKKINSLLPKDITYEVSSDWEKDLVRKASVALWVLNSTYTNATVEDVLAYTKETDLQKALIKIEEDLEKENKINVWLDIEKPLIPILKKIEQQGINFDTKKCALFSAEYRKKIESLRKKIHEAVGEEFNINSPKQLSEILFNKLKLHQNKRRKKTSSGMRSTKESVLLQMKEDHIVIPLILEYRKYEKLRSTYVDALPEFVDSEGKIHTTLQQNGTTTGRMSSKNPNLQNIPAFGDEGKKIRSLFIPKDGWLLLSADYSQMEMRIASILSQDKHMLDIFKSDIDIHRAVASRIFSIPEENITPEQRNHTKAINFGILYGMGAKSLSLSAGISFSDAKEFLEAYKSAFPTLFNYIDGIKKEAHRKGFVTTAFGRTRTIEGINSSLPFVRAQAEREAINSPIQGTSADIIKKAMIGINERIKEEKSEDLIHMLLQIHDEILFEVHTDVLDVWATKIQDEMESVFPLNKKPIKLKTEISYGLSWGEKKKYIKK